MIFPVHFHGQKDKNDLYSYQGWYYLYCWHAASPVGAHGWFIVYSVMHFLILISGFLNGIWTGTCVKGNVIQNVK